MSKEQNSPKETFLDLFVTYSSNANKFWQCLKEWEKYDKLRPDYERYVADLKYIERKNKKLEKEYEKKMLENAEELTKQQIELDAVAAEKQKLIDEMNELKGVKTEKTNSPK